MPKQKTHKGMKKRFKVTASGKATKRSAFRGHILSKKNGKRKSRHRDSASLEAAAAIIGRSGPAPRANLESAARFSGGIPAVVEALGRGSRDHGGVPRSRAGLVRALGPLAEEIRFAIDIANADSMLSDRLEQLLSGEPLLEVPEVDKPLMMAGLLRRVRMPGEDRVLLRAPAIGAIVT